MTKTRIIVWATLALAVLSLTVTTYAVQNAPVNIVYPIHLQSYEDYFEASFSTTCPGGSHVLEWYIDGTLIGQGEFYDQMSVQLSQKAGTGWHTLEVRSPCGADGVRFFVL